ALRFQKHYVKVVAARGRRLRPPDKKRAQRAPAHAYHQATEETINSRRKLRSIGPVDQSFLNKAVGTLCTVLNDRRAACISQMTRIKVAKCTLCYLRRVHFS